jgi:hypothetical protein
MLFCLESLYLTIEKYRQRAGYWAWCCQQLRQQTSQHIPLRSREQWGGLVEKVGIDAQVQRTLGFDFGAWFDEFDRGIQDAEEVPPGSSK